MSSNKDKSYISLASKNLSSTARQRTEGLKVCHKYCDQLLTSKLLLDLGADPNQQSWGLATGVFGKSLFSQREDFLKECMKHRENALQGKPAFVGANSCHVNPAARESNVWDVVKLQILNVLGLLRDPLGDKDASALKLREQQLAASKSNMKNACQNCQLGPMHNNYVRHAPVQVDLHNCFAECLYIGLAFLCTQNFWASESELSVPKTYHSGIHSACMHCCRMRLCMDLTECKSKDSPHIYSKREANLKKVETYNKFLDAMEEEGKKALKRASQDDVLVMGLTNLLTKIKDFIGELVCGPDPWVSALHLAARYGLSDLCVLLLDRGATVMGGQAAGISQRTPFEEALKYARSNFRFDNCGASEYQSSDIQQCCILLWIWACSSAIGANQMMPNFYCRSTSAVAVESKGKRRTFNLRILGFRNLIAVRHNWLAFERYMEEIVAKHPMSAMAAAKEANQKMGKLMKLMDPMALGIKAVSRCRAP
eukprot:1159952-Pelagomonas_calceolata.AAC.4